MRPAVSAKKQGNLSKFDCLVGCEGVADAKPAGADNFAVSKLREEQLKVPKIGWPSRQFAQAPLLALSLGDI